ncbi:MAG: hypothetical protein KC731_11225 [Myxococcales bacterium]|nr:hypothetical protein [Myxococcales bacterium]
MAAPWAYEDEPLDELAPSSAPRWECPGGVCDCHAEPLTNEHRIYLFDHLGNLMPGARCRILVGKRVINESMPNADSRGAVVFRRRGMASGEVVE